MIHDTQHRLTRHGSASSGFTIVELLVVIAIISVLVGMILPAMRSVRITSHQTSEMNTARHLMAAYHAYANANRDHVLPGFPPKNEFEVYNQSGHAMTGEVPGIAMQCYTWRIAPYLDFHIDGLFVNQHRDLLELVQHDTPQDYLYKTSVAPSLGLNTQWVGGDSSAQPPAFLSPNTDEDGNIDQQFKMWHDLIDMRRYYVTRTSQVIYPHRLLVFASARSADTAGLIGPGGIVEGNYRVTSPYTSEINPDLQWSESFNVNEHPSKHGFISPRYFRRAVTAFMDGSVNTLDTRQLRDMRHWANWADSEDWVLPLKD